MQGYLLGIDLGNTKTEYLLCTAEGEFVDIYNVKSPGRENMEAALSGVKRQMSVLLDRNNIGIGDVAALGIGLSIPHSTEAKPEIKNQAVKILGVSAIDVSTDTGHGTYAYRLGKGAGIYSFASTGDITMGMTLDGKWAIVGGLRLFAGDEASGSFLYRRALSLMYDHRYRCGGSSIAFPELIALLGLDESDLHRSLKSIAGDSLRAKSTEIIKIMDWAALAGDGIAMTLFKEAGESAGKSAAGCFANMGPMQDNAKDGPAPIVLIGSIWNRIIYDGMRDTFKYTVENLTGRECDLMIPEAPPVCGSVMKAKEAVDGKRVTEDFRARVLGSTALKSTEIEIAELSERGVQDCDILRQYIVIRKNRPKTAERLDVDRRIMELMSGYPLLGGVGAELASALMPAVCSIMRDEHEKAFALLASASSHINVKREHIEEYNNLLCACSAAAGNKDFYIRFAHA